MRPLQYPDHSKFFCRMLSLLCCDYLGRFLNSPFDCPIDFFCMNNTEYPDFYTDHLESNSIIAGAISSNHGVLFVMVHHIDEVQL